MVLHDPISICEHNESFTQRCHIIGLIENCIDLQTTFPTPATTLLWFTSTNQWNHREGNYRLAKIAKTNRLEQGFSMVAIHRLNVPISRNNNGAKLHRFKTKKKRNK